MRLRWIAPDLRQEAWNTTLIARGDVRRVVSYTKQAVFIEDRWGTGTMGPFPWSRFSVVSATMPELLAAFDNPFAVVPGLRKHIGVVPRNEKAITQADLPALNDENGDSSYAHGSVDSSST